jgi:hypothetical protein
MELEVDVKEFLALPEANLPNRYRAAPLVFDEFHRLVGQFVPSIPQIKP